jgi:hypothetical protein
VERQLKEFKAMTPTQEKMLRSNIVSPPYTLRVHAEDGCSASGLRDDMFWGEVRTTPSGELVPCTRADVRCPYEEEPRPARTPHITKEITVRSIRLCSRVNIHCPYEDKPTFRRCRASLLGESKEALVPYHLTRREWQQWERYVEAECRRSLKANASE